MHFKNAGKHKYCHSKVVLTKVKKVGHGESETAEVY